ncbi:tRNA (adenosine(37)-N6)-threonylcarbamoyltransferase complex dimerization subunit type 1 TsaB [Chitinophaga rhizosphaerae]|uniref:tRNA (adenosine(37)-N6)-threonylcarbamoyltransferase complex dimerization subunit type 1 TsaB n=1 Tax=Chitinophaga rhizosphaerae TaxID=1864947 RepID=UPI000F8144E4|nr:tRNA (adenosine(37)-N6)-threonylcarbamoyltransferase complex dimerization subunit type 1 TsaB [Chitinophaga rhizosphaerae]
MAQILHIDTATSIGSVCLARNGQVVETIHNTDQREHAATITRNIGELMKRHGVAHTDIDAIAVSAGPGSYTGLRVGTATAKGLCYTWKKPLIAISTLQMMAAGMQAQRPSEDVLYAPMIDARRMEVFTAVFDQNLEALLPPQAMVLEPHSLDNFIAQKTVIFFGDGAPKWRQLLGEPTNTLFPSYEISAGHMVGLAAKAFADKDFQDVAYFAPHYLKAFFHPGKK